tara:strand:- start:463 stop:981 length:519 start_codon:yes stop_codon:yes gene_type:complete
MNEIWKDVVGYEGVYQVSNLGSVKSLTRIVTCKKGNKKLIKGIIKNQSLNYKRYLNTNLSKGGKNKTKRIHQLVAEAFLNHKPCGHKLVVDHINNVKTDNRLENLQVISHRENSSKDKKGSSEYTGVSWNKRAKKWKVSLKSNGKEKHLGYFTDELKASEAYQNALSNIINN